MLSSSSTLAVFMLHATQLRVFLVDESKDHTVFSRASMQLHFAAKGSTMVTLEMETDLDVHMDLSKTYHMCCKDSHMYSLHLEC